MSRGVQWSLLGSAVVAALIALAGCSHYLYGERETWRREAEVACLNSGAVQESPERVRISAIDGPGICGMDFPLRVSALGDSAPLGYDDEALRPPAAIPDAALPQRWPLVQSNALPPAAPPIQPQYSHPQYGPPPSGPPPMAPRNTLPRRHLNTACKFLRHRPAHRCRFILRALRRLKKTIWVFSPVRRGHTAMPPRHAPPHRP